MSFERSAFGAVCFDYVVGIRSDSDLWRTVFEFLSFCVAFIFYLGPAGKKSSQNIQRCCNARFLHRLVEMQGASSRGDVTEKLEK